MARIDQLLKELLQILRLSFSMEYKNDFPSLIFGARSGVGDGELGGRHREGLRQLRQDGAGGRLVPEVRSLRRVQPAVDPLLQRSVP